MKIASTELMASGAILALATAIATGYLNPPRALVATPAMSVVFVILGLIAFMNYPAAGLALFFLTAVLFYKRNIGTTMAAAAATYGDVAIMNAEVARKAAAHSSMSSGPREYEQFQETDAANPMIGPLMEGFEPAPYGDEQGSPIDGQFPKEAERASASADSQEYVYRPDADTGSNEFVRIGPDMDEKKTAFAYNN
jgi:hypothetical protein